MHILQKGFTRIRHYGILYASLKQAIIPLLQDQVGSVKIKEQEPIKHRICPACQKGELIVIRYFDNRGPPKLIKTLSKSIIKAMLK